MLFIRGTRPFTKNFVAKFLVLFDILFTNNVDCILSFMGHGRFMLFLDINVESRFNV